MLCVISKGGNHVASHPPSSLQEVLLDDVPLGTPVDLTGRVARLGYWAARAELPSPGCGPGMCSDSEAESGFHGDQFDEMFHTCVDASGNIEDIFGTSAMGFQIDEPPLHASDESVGQPCTRDPYPVGPTPAVLPTAPTSSSLAPWSVDNSSSSSSSSSGESSGDSDGKPAVMERETLTPKMMVVMLVMMTGRLNRRPLGPVSDHGDSEFDSIWPSAVSSTLR